MEERIGVLVVEPGRPPREVTLPNTVKAFETAVGGEIQMGCFLPKRVLLISREDMGGLVPNRPIPGGEGYVGGTFLLCGIPEEGSSLASLTPQQKKEFGEVFARPGEFMSVGGKVCCDPDDAADEAYRLWDALRDGESVTLTKWGGRGGGMEPSVVWETKGFFGKNRGKEEPEQGQCDH